MMGSFGAFNDDMLRFTSEDTAGYYTIATQRPGTVQDNKEMTNGASRNRGIEIFGHLEALCYDTFLR